MIVRTLAEAEKTDRRVVAENGNWQSVRLSLKEDKMGHSFNITTIFKGTKTHIKYANHWESVYVISGKGKIEMVESGDVYELTPGTIICSTSTTSTTSLVARTRTWWWRAPSPRPSAARKCTTRTASTRPILTDSGACQPSEENGTPGFRFFWPAPRDSTKV